MKKLILPFVMLGLVLLNSCGPSVRIVSDVDENSAFDQYTTYNFLAFTEGNQKTIPGMELERLKVAFAREIEKRGLEFTEQGADVSVQITVFHREARKGYSPYSGYHYMERAISIDFYENTSRKHVWHAAAVGELERDPDKRKENFALVAEALFDKYPVPLPAVEEGV